MAGGPSSPKSASPSGTVNSLLPGSFGSSTSSSQPGFTGQKSMTSDSLSAAATASAHPFSLSPISERNALDHSNAKSLLSFGHPKLETSISNPDVMDPSHSVIIRRLPRTANPDFVRTMLLFSQDMIDVNLVDPDFPEDKGYVSAVARFRTQAGANEAREKLNGKSVSSDSHLVVEMLHPHGAASSAGSASNANGLGFPRRNTVDGVSMRHGSGSSSSVTSVNGGSTTRQSSRFNGTFQNLERISPPTSSLGGVGDALPVPESASSHNIQSLFSPQSPLANSAVSSKSIINDDPSDETGKLLNDPVAFAKSGESSQMPISRRVTNPSIPVSRFAGLSLTTNNNPALNGPSMSGLASPRSMGTTTSPSSSLSPNGIGHIPGLGPNTTYPMNPQHFHRPNYPPVNPADQNPPCNTLYVGNLPVDTSEDELKAIFSKQRGYKRLCFRTKQNGPMCFVEFEDTSFATKALNDLYGQPLHNSVKGGIRLSFSKNPLGVRSNHNNSVTMSNSMNPHSAMPGIGGTIGTPHGFATATGPPPGLSAPPGLGPIGSGPGLSAYANGGFNMGSGNFGNGAGSMRQTMTNGLGNSIGTSMAGGGFGGLSGDYAAYMSR